jgi:hypothetical protein
MPAMRIPAEHAAPLRALAALPPRTAGRVAKTIEETPPFTSMMRMVEIVHASLPKTAKDISAAQLVIAFTSLVAERGDADLGRLSLRLAASPDLGLEREREPKVAQIFSRILNAPAVINFGKADDVITDHARVFSRARILTDIRPVFGSQATEPPSAAVLVEMLHIDYWSKGGGTGSFYVALDHADLLELKEVVDRGLEKTETLKRFLTSAGLEYYQHQEVSNAES